MKSAPMPPISIPRGMSTNQWIPRYAIVKTKRIVLITMNRWYGQCVHSLILMFFSLQWSQLSKIIPNGMATCKDGTALSSGS